MDWCTSGVGLQVLPFIDNSYLERILRFQRCSRILLLRYLWFISCRENWYTNTKNNNIEMYIEIIYTLVMCVGSHFVYRSNATLSKQQVKSSSVHMFFLLSSDDRKHDRCMTFMVVLSDRGTIFIGSILKCFLVRLISLPPRCHLIGCNLKSVINERNICLYYFLKRIFLI